MSVSCRVIAGFALLWASASPAQVPASLSDRLWFSLGAAEAGFERYSVERTADGRYLFSADVDLQVPNLHIIQHVEVEAGDELAFQRAHIRAVVNADTSEVMIEREGGQAKQITARGGTSATARIETPPGSVLLSNNVIHQVVQFAWLHDGTGAKRQEFIAFPRVPVTVVLERTGSVSREGEDLMVRRYFLNLANRLGAYVWLTGSGWPLKVSVPLQSFEAVSERYREWADLLEVGREGPASGPPPAADYAAEDLSFPSDSITLAGTLTMPRGQGPWPATVLISGSGAQDRDENTPGPGGLKLSIFRSVAEALTARGIAVLRYDDRGVGGSGGELASAGLSDLVGDVRAVLRYLRSRDDIDDRRIALVGHSEGGIIAPIVAADDAEVAAIVLMAGTALPLDAVLLEQALSGAVEAGGDSADLARTREAVEELVQAIREGRDLEETGLPPGLKLLGRQSKWLREHMEHDPVATLGRVRASVLIANGGQDVQVAPEHARRLAAVLERADHPDYELKIFPRLNHLFAVSRGEGSAEYADPSARVDEEFLSFLADWLAARLGRR